MRHRKTGRKLNRTWEHRKAMFRNMTRSLLVHQRIRTTEPKAKELRKVMDRLITLTKTDTLHSRRKAYKVLGNHSLVKMLFEEIGPRYAEVPGGYTRVVKMGLPRRGDSAPMAFIELTRRPGEEAAPAEKPAKAAPKAQEPAPQEPAEEKEEAPVTPSAEQTPPEASAPEGEEAPEPEEPQEPEQAEEAEKDDGEKKSE